MNSGAQKDRSFAEPESEESAQDPREAAIAVLEHHWAMDNGKINFPVDPVAISRKLGIDVLLSDLDNEVTGILVKRPNDTNSKIYLNSQEDERLQRYTCAYQLGRFVHGQETFKDQFAFVDTDSIHGQPQKSGSQLWNARFASELLMPAAAVRALWAQGQSIQRISRVLGVTQKAVNNRLANLGLS